MPIGGDDCSNDIITLGTCFSMFVYICARFRFSLIGGNLTGQWTGSRRGIGGEIQIPETQLQARRLRNPQREIQNSRLSGVHAVITRGFSCLASSFGLYGDLCKAIDVSARGLSRNIPLCAPFGTQGRLAILFVHIFIIIGSFSILKQTFATLHRSCARYNFFVFSRTLTSVRAKRARHPRFFFIYVPPLDDI